MLFNVMFRHFLITYRAFLHRFYMSTLHVKFVARLGEKRFRASFEIARQIMLFLIVNLSNVCSRSRYRLCTNIYEGHFEGEDLFGLGAIVVTGDIRGMSRQEIPQ